MKIKKGDTVLVISGNYKGKKGKVIEVIPKENRLIVEGINKKKVHKKPRRTGEPGGIIEKELPISISNVKFICPSCGEAVRVGFKFLEDKKKVRYCRKCNEVVEK
ncbi:MAG: 50S ribosomal protein L24 [candidate division WOR-3 bacterium]